MCRFRNCRNSLRPVAGLARSPLAQANVTINNLLPGAFDTDRLRKTVEAAALADEGVIRALEGKAPKKVIVVPNRIVNIVA